MTDPTYREEFDNKPFHKQLGITLVEQRRGFGKIQLRKDADTPGGIGGSVHGGVLASMVDIAMIVAVFSDLGPDDEPAGTAELGITYLRQAHGDVIFAKPRWSKEADSWPSLMWISSMVKVTCAPGVERSTHFEHERKGIS